MWGEILRSQKQISYLSKSLFFITILIFYCGSWIQLPLFCLKACLRVEKDLWVLVSERFYVIGTLRSNFLLHKKSVSGLSPETDFFIAYFFSDQISVLFASETFFYKNYNCYDCCQKNNHEWKNRCIISCLNCSLSCRIWRTRCLILC